MRKFLTVAVVTAMMFCLSGCTFLIPLALMNLEEETEYKYEDWDDFSEEDDFTIPVPTRPEIPTTEEITTEEPTTEETTTLPEHSKYYIQGLDVDTLIRYFCEVVCDAEFSEGSGDSSLVQKWQGKIKYYVNGNPSSTDMMFLQDTVDYVNSIYGFPGMEETSYEWDANLQIYFVNNDELIEIMGSNFYNSDGGVTFWYDGYNRIYEAKICYRNDIDQYVRNSVIIEEIYNGLGPVQDTMLRPDSIIYSEYTTPQNMTKVDKLIMELLYHPDIKCGMNADECAEVIRNLYY